MINFNDDNIFVGYIKQLLKDFNLPKYRVYTQENQDYFEKNKQEKDIFETILRDDKDNPNPHTRYISYIKDNFIQRYINHEWVVYRNKPYIYNEPLLNQTSNLIIKNNYYDSDTHEYLGNYLRFQRDYNHLNLMPLYNCFSNRLCSNLKISFNRDLNYCYEVKDTSKPWTGKNVVKVIATNDRVITSSARNVQHIPGIEEIVFDSSNSDYKIYMVPVKLFQTYTIAIDSSTPVEMCCGIYGKYLDTREKFSKIPEFTYKKYNNMFFNHPILYEELLSDNLFTKIKDQLNTDESSLELAQNEVDLKLFIKLSANNRSSITILEGDYRHWNDRTVYTNLKQLGQDKNVDILKVVQNKTITNFDEYDEDRKFTPISSLSLLAINTTVSKPFSDRLIEYLVENTITHLDPNSDNIRRVQKVIHLNYPNMPLLDGEWGNKIRPILYNYMMNLYDKDLFMNVSEMTCDSLGYVDKNTEKMYSHVNKSDGESVSILNADIYNK